MFVKCFYVELYTGRQDTTTHYHTGRCVRMVLQRRQDTAYTGPPCVRQDIYRQDTLSRQDTSVLYVDRTPLVSVRSINVRTATSHTGPPHINLDRKCIYKKGCSINIPNLTHLIIIQIFISYFNLFVKQRNFILPSMLDYSKSSNLCL